MFGLIPTKEIINHVKRHVARRTNMSVESARSYNNVPAHPEATGVNPSSPAYATFIYNTTESSEVGVKAAIESAYAVSTVKAAKTESRPV